MGAKPRAFKHQLGAGRVRQIADLLAEAAPGFDGPAFEVSAARGLSSMELKARVRHIIAALHEHLPQPFPRAAAAILAAVKLDAARRDGGDRHLRGFAAWPLTDYLGEHGLEHREIALAAMRILTERFSAEFAIRPFLIHASIHANKATLAELRRWTRDDSEHVRRLVSEGTRPLLPWGQRLAGFRADPAPVIELLETLRDDPSEYVRRSVANNLNDIAKDHPERVVDLCRTWWQEADDKRRWLIKRALRTRIKAGDAAALAVLGFGRDVELDVGAIALEPAVVHEGEAITMRFRITSGARDIQRLNIDYAVHYVKADGSRRPKVFKLKTLELAPGEATEIAKRHSMKAVTTRVHRSGMHCIELLINGTARGRAEFELIAQLESNK